MPATTTVTKAKTKTVKRIEARKKMREGVSTHRMVQDVASKRKMTSVPSVAITFRRFSDSQCEWKRLKDILVIDEYDSIDGEYADDVVRLLRKDGIEPDCETHPEGARLDTDRIKILMDSLLVNGMTEPLKYFFWNGKNQIKAGRHRWTVLYLLYGGDVEVPVVRHCAESLEDARHQALEDNNSRKAYLTEKAYARIDDCIRDGFSPFAKTRQEYVVRCLFGANKIGRQNPDFDFDVILGGSGSKKSATQNMLSKAIGRLVKKGNNPLTEEQFYDMFDHAVVFVNAYYNELKRLGDKEALIRENHSRGEKMITTALDHADTISEGLYSFFMSTHVMDAACQVGWFMMYQYPYQDDEHYRERIENANPEESGRRVARGAAELFCLDYISVSGRTTTSTLLLFLSQHCDFPKKEWAHVRESLCSNHALKQPASILATLKEDIARASHKKSTVWW